MAQDAIMKQYRDLKAKHPDALLLFRCGDFYESHGEDAKICAKELGITLTYRNDDKTPMAGFPYHALDTYLPKLIRAGHRIAICDQLEDPKLRKTVKRGINNEQNKQSSQTMAQNIKAADLIGKTIVNKEGSMSYRVMNVEGDKLEVEFLAGGRPAVTMPMPIAQFDKLLAGGWQVQGDVKPETSGTTASEDTVEEVSDVQPEPVKKLKKEQPAKPKKSQPKAEKKQEPKIEKPKAEPGRFVYSTYENAKGKTCARIRGLKEDDAAYKNATDLHASATYERDKKGNRNYMLIFGPRYAAAAKEVCEALNAGKPLADCKAIIDHATEERAARREEWKAKRAAYQEGGNVKPETKSGYSDKDVAQMLKTIMAGGDIPESIKKAMAA